MAFILANVWVPSGSWLFSSGQLLRPEPSALPRDEPRLRGSKPLRSPPDVLVVPAAVQQQSESASKVFRSAATAASALQSPVHCPEKSPGCVAASLCAGLLTCWWFLQLCSSNLFAWVQRQRTEAGLAAKCQQLDGPLSCTGFKPRLQNLSLTFGLTSSAGRVRRADAYQRGAIVKAAAGFGPALVAAVIDTQD